MNEESTILNEFLNQTSSNQSTESLTTESLEVFRNDVCLYLEQISAGIQFLSVQFFIVTISVVVLMLISFFKGLLK